MHLIPQGGDQKNTSVGENENGTLRKEKEEETNHRFKT